MADGKRGRRPDSPELKAAKMALRAATTDEAKATAQAGIDAITAREQAAKAVAAAPVLDEKELFELLIENEPHVRKAEEAMRRLGTAFGSMAVARQRLALYRCAMTAEGEAKARAVLDMRGRVAARLDEDGSPSASAAPEMHAA